MFKTILVPTDGSVLSDKAILAAVDFAKATGGKLIGLSVAEPYPYMRVGRDYGYFRQNDLNSLI